jgi:hypothetical protein
MQWLLGGMTMGDLKDEPKRIATRGATAGVLLYAVIAFGFMVLVILLLLRAFM